MLERSVDIEYEAASDTVGNSNSITRSFKFVTPLIRVRGMTFVPCSYTVVLFQDIVADGFEDPGVWTIGGGSSGTIGKSRKLG